MVRTLKAVANTLPSEITISLADKDLREYLTKVQHGDVKSEILHLVKIGLMCVTRANTNNEVDYWEKKSQQLQTNLVKGIEESIKKLVGAKDGQLLAPIADQVHTTSKFIDTALVNSENRIKSTVSDLSNSVSDGKLAECFSKVVIKELTPLISEIKTLNYHVVGQKGEENIKSITTLKGREYEQYVLEKVIDWAKHNRFTVENVGVDNKPGDIVLESLTEKIKTAIEVKDISTPKGRSVLTREMGTVIQQRKATIAVFLSKTINGLAKEIGSYGEGISDGIKWVATTGDSLEVALNHCLVEERLRLANEKNPNITNAKKVKESLGLAKTLLSYMSQHYRSITEIHNSATALEASLKKTTSEVLRALDTANDLIAFN